MADNVGITPGSGATAAADNIDGVLYQRVKLVHGADGVNDGDVSAANPMPAVTSRTDNLIVMLSRIVKLLESSAVVDQQQRQRISIDAIPGGITLPTVTTVTTVASVTNVAANAGMDREQYINIAKQTYAQSIRSRLTFV